LKREESWVLAAVSVSGLSTSPMALLLSISGLVADRACARWCFVSLRVVPAWPTGMATNTAFPHNALRALTSGAFFAVFS
jgi:hypothetical protein